MKYTQEYIYDDKGQMPVDIVRDIVAIGKKYAGKRMTVTLTNNRKRTSPQNRWLHAVINLISNWMRNDAKERGDELYYEINPEVTKLWIKQKFLGYYEDEKHEKHLRETRNLTTIECNELFELLQRHFAPLGLDIPEPNEYK